MRKLNLIGGPPAALPHASATSSDTLFAGTSTPRFDGGLSNSEAVALPSDSGDGSRIERAALEQVTDPWSTGGTVDEDTDLWW